MLKDKETIPIFFAVDDAYMACLAVALQSLIDNSSKDNFYLIKILNTNINDENKKRISKYERENVSIEFVDLNYYIEKVKDKLYTRDYYSKTTYFRLFIPNLYPQFDKVLYLDSDIVILDDIAKLYNIDMGDNLVAAAPDDVIQKISVFAEYAEKVVGVADYRNYFNAGILLMNLDELRKFDFQKKFLYSLEEIRFAVAQDQDYLNRLCKGRVKLISKGWNRMPMPDPIPNEEIKLIHYNLAYKPWHFEDIMYKEYFWKYAQKTEYFDEIKKMKENYSEEQKFKDREQDRKLRELAQKECDCVGDDRKLKRNVEATKKKSQERLEILQRIEELEKEGRFDLDVEDDPPTIPLAPEDVDYLKTKTTSKIKAILANRAGERFLNEILKDNRLIIKQIKGIENFDNLKTGAMITCNHFNPFDSFTIEQVYRMSNKNKKKKLYKVIREGNYTNFPGFYGFLFRNCDTLPLSSNKKTMVDFMKAVNKILKRGDYILIYPEQSLWWNYKKPKPLKNGAYKMATRANVPILPVFITMQDSNIIGDDGFPVQEYTVNIGKPIYPNEKLSEKANTEAMKNENFEIWKKVYEDSYGIKLSYTCDEDKLKSAEE